MFIKYINMYIKNPLIDKTRGSVDFSWQCLGSSNLLVSGKKKAFYSCARS